MTIDLVCKRSQTGHLRTGRVFDTSLSVIVFQRTTRPTNKVYESE